MAASRSTTRSRRSAPRSVGCTVYAPVPKPRDPKVDRYAPKPGDSAAVAAWRSGWRPTRPRRSTRTSGDGRMHQRVGTWSWLAPCAGARPGQGQGSRAVVRPGAQPTGLFGPAGLSRSPGGTGWRTGPGRRGAGARSARGPGRREAGVSRSPSAPFSTTVSRSPLSVISNRFHWPGGLSAFTFGVTPARTSAGMLRVGAVAVHLARADRAAPDVDLALPLPRSKMPLSPASVTSCVFVGAVGVLRVVAVRAGSPAAAVVFGLPRQPPVDDHPKSPYSFSVQRFLSLASLLPS